MSGEAQAVWARAFFDELVRAGVGDVTVAPGSRSTPLVLAAASRAGLRLRVHADERSAAFFALGVGKATGRPAAVVTTSGTAVANLLPAVVEAAWSETPLLLLTADRPHRLRGADANQTIDQLGIFGRYVRAFHDVAPASLEVEAVRHLRVLADRAVADAVGRPAGPVHLNFPFEKPLEPAAGAAVPEPWEAVPGAYPRGRPGRPLVRVCQRRASVDPMEIAALARRVDRAERGVIVAGPVARPAEVGEAAVELAAATGFPLLADPLSGARWGPDGGAAVVGHYDLVLDAPEARAALRPDLVLRFGQAPTSAALGRWLDEHREVRQVVVDGGDRWKDHGASAGTYLRADPAVAMDALVARVKRPGSAASGWRELWRSLDAVAAAAVEASDAFGPGHEGDLAVGVIERMAPDDILFVGSSMPVRDVDAFGPAAPREARLCVLGNRGASGIDGTISTALGVAAGSGHRVVALLGDLAFLHDMGGLLATREADAEVVFIVVNNDGGGIFHMLPVREHEPEFTRFFATPHGLDLHHVAAMHGLLHEAVDDPADFRAALGRALDGEGSRVLEIRTDRDENERRRRAVREAVRDAVTEKLTEEHEEEESRE